jgi:hypothetical protein
LYAAQAVLKFLVTLPPYPVEYLAVEPHDERRRIIETRKAATYTARWI